jgi:para-aminobenzoate synthetase component 1
MSHEANHRVARPCVVELDVEADVEAALVSLAGEPVPAVLESTAVDPTYGRFTILAYDPVHTLSLDRSEPGVIERLESWMAAFPACAASPEVPFVGGFVGFLSYEAGLGIEGICPTTTPDIPLPTARFALYDSAAVFDHLTRRWYAVAVDWPAGSCPQRPPVERRLADVRRRLESAVMPPAKGQREPLCPLPEPSVTRRQYLAAVERAKHYIEAGDAYQINLTQRFSTTTDASPLEVYRRLRRANPSWYAALLTWGDQAVISASPELFLDLRGCHVVTRPIKGTRPRTGDETLDNLRRRELTASEKDRAELTMIVDLLRNDLGRVCEFGSVRVLSPADLEVHPTVYHLVATIEGQLREECDWADLLRASFPGGSITGAPKVRAMQIIDELELRCRSAYCGSIGYIGLDGSMCLNIAIRTMVAHGRDLHLFAGGGIVADSDPEDEYEETLAKAAGMLRALGHDRAQSVEPLVTEARI